MKSFVTTLSLSFMVGINHAQYQTQVSSNGNYLGVYTGPNTTISWEDAETWCLNNVGQHLASIHSNSENIEAADSRIVIDNAWIGLNDKANEGTFEWIDGTTYSYSNWDSGEPNERGTGEDCVHFWGSGREYKWNDDGCKYQGRVKLWNNFICNRATPNPTPYPTPNPTPYPTPSPTPYPTPQPTPAPTDTPTPAPTNNPTPAPTDNPTEEPTPAPTSDPTAAPTSSPTWYPPCYNNPCHCESNEYGPNEDPNCLICHVDPGNGCDQCQNGPNNEQGYYWKKDYNYPCVQCQSVFGNECLFCQDFNGCGQCRNGYDRVLDEQEDIWYCVPSGQPIEEEEEPPQPPNSCPINYSSCNGVNNICPPEAHNGHCTNQENWGCTECQNGYWFESFNYPCVSCNIIPHCLLCDNWTGCQICEQGFTQTWTNECGENGYRICL